MSEMVSLAEPSLTRLDVTGRYSCDIHRLYVQPRLTQSGSNDSRLKHDIFCCWRWQSDFPREYKGCAGLVSLLPAPPLLGKVICFVTLLDELISSFSDTAPPPSPLDRGGRRRRWRGGTQCIGIHLICRWSIWSHHHPTVVSSLSLALSGVMELFAQWDLSCHSCLSASE